MLWYDTTLKRLRLRSEANDAWIDLGTLDQVNKLFTPFVGGSFTTTGTITANAFVGSGAGLTGIEPTTSAVLSATANASVGAVGSYAFLGETSNSTTTAYGATRAGSALRPAGIVGGASFANTSLAQGIGAGQNTALAGTWRCMGVSRPNQVGETGGGDPIFGFGATLWLRIS
jgi:hypothetical protein